MGQVVKTRMDYSRMKTQLAPFAYTFSSLLSISILTNPTLEDGKQKEVKEKSSLLSVNNL